MTDINNNGIIPHSNGNGSQISTTNTTNSSNSSTPVRSGTRLCNYFAQGNCRNGNECRFSHDLTLFQHAHDNQSDYSSPQPSPTYRNYQNNPRNNNNNNNNNFGHKSGSPTNYQPTFPYPPNMMVNNSGYNMPPPPPPPILINIHPNQPIYCIDVECVATGTHHNARAVAQVAMVDQWSRVVFNAYIRQEMPVVSYLTEIHGITKEILEENGIPLADALAELRSHLSPSAILIGQSIHKDIHWLQLAQGIDFHSFINLSDVFRVWNPTHNAYTNFSLDHCAKVWLGVERKTHEALVDAAISMSLFNSYRHIQWNPPQLMELQRMTLTAPRIPGFSSVHPVIDGCCMGNRKKCVCGAPFE